MRQNQPLLSSLTNMTHIAKDSPRGTAPAINRKTHTKSRTGCYGCKARRVKVRENPYSIGRRGKFQKILFDIYLSKLKKCPETRPVCDNCRFRRLDCVYLSQFKSQSHTVTRLLQPNYNNKNYAAAVHFTKPLLPPPSTKPVTVLPQFSLFSRSTICASSITT